MGVEINFTGRCKGCKFAKLELDESRIRYVNHVPIRVYSIYCEHEEACNMWDERIKNNEPREFWKSL